MIIITGASGFIGSALAWKLNDMGRTDLLLVDEIGISEKWKNLVPLRFQDYMEKNDFLLALQNGQFNNSSVEAILHLGACSATTEKDGSYLIKNNFEYSKVLTQWCMDHKARFIYASSAATYGNGENHYTDDESQIGKLRPLNMYGYSKQIFDLWLQEKKYLKDCVGLKYFNVYGPNEYHKGDMKSMVVKAFQQIQAQGKVQLFKSHRPDYKDGEQLRDFVYIKSAVEMTLFFLDKKIPGGLYNVGTGQARSWVDMMNAIFKCLGKNPCIDFIPMPEGLREKYQYFTEAKLDKIHSVGFKGKSYSLEEGIADFLPYLQNEFQPLGW